MTIRIEFTNGTIETCTGFEQSSLLSAGGGFQFTMPASDGNSSLVQPLAAFTVYWDSTAIGAGIVDDYTVAGEVLTVRGSDLTRELATKAVNYSASAQVNTIVNALASLLPAGWTLVNGTSGATTVVNINCIRDSVLNLVNTVCQIGGLWWYVQGRQITITNQYGAVSAGITPIKLTRTIDSYNVVSRIYPFGAGDGQAALTIKPSSLSVAGFTKNTTSNYINNDSSLYAGRERRIDFKNIAPLENSHAGVQAASNTLVAAGVQYLIDNADPIVSYSAEVIFNGVIKPLDRIAIGYKDESLTVNETLVVTETRIRVTPETLVTVGLTLEAKARRIESDNEIVADAIRAARISPVYPQLRMADDSAFASASLPQNTESSFLLQMTPNVTQLKQCFLSVDKKANKETVFVGTTPVTYELPVTSQVQYRINGSGSWTNIGTTPVDITSVLVNATTEYPTASQFTINLKTAATSEQIDAPGTPMSGGFGYPPTLVILRCIQQFGASNVLNGWTMYNNSHPTTTDVVVRIPVGGCIQVIDSTPVIDGNRWFYQCGFGQYSGYVMLYFNDTGNVSSTTGSAAYTGNFSSSMISALVRMKNVTQTLLN